MTIGVLSDTHSLKIPALLLERFKTVDLIIHAGDVCDSSTLNELKKLAPLKAVQGNMDDPPLKKQLPVQEVLEYEGVTIGLTHGHIGPGPNARKNAETAFAGQKMDIVIFGHSHQALKETGGKTLYFNPGSPNDAVRAQFFSYGLITVQQGKVKAEIVKF